MQKWEYCVVTGLNAPLGLEWHTKYPAITNFTYYGAKTEMLRKQQNQTEDNVVAHVIAKLGEDGWEMVGTAIAGEQGHLLYFKRPRQDI